MTNYNQVPLSSCQVFVILREIKEGTGEPANAFNVLPFLQTPDVHDGEAPDMYCALHVLHLNTKRHKTIISNIHQLKKWP